MAQETINIGAAPDDNTGESIRSAFNKTNNNFTELYGDKTRFTAKQEIGATSGTINLDTSSYSIFELTAALTAATTLNIQNIVKGQVIDILVTGAQTITMASDFTTASINQEGSGAYDGSTNNHIQVLCLDDNDADAILLYAVAPYTADTDPS